MHIECSEERSLYFKWPHRSIRASGAIGRTPERRPQTGVGGTHHECTTLVFHSDMSFRRLSPIRLARPCLRMISADFSSGVASI